MRNFAFALAGAVLSACYWWFVVTIAYGLVAGDPGPAAPPRSEMAQNVTSAVVFVVAVVVYAVGTLGWQRVVAKNEMR